MITKTQEIYLFIKSLDSDDMLKLRNITKAERSELVKAYNNVYLFKHYRTNNNKIINIFKKHGFYTRVNKLDSTTTIFY